ncbi:cca tRNA nucleotidyltransferase mitochondrial [Phtheirospermum japonicum]|uniref:Cca tRNA nucleotidyltransferase mitochondrial n=1 Tax=Phtheirospermum japonicum TaxID=374723 RepID=A0A830B2M3_9LAMI|nr:cca tRNA nucleotidyltransferase mitochondrial [Phtheirospermum japonicum]
MKLLINPRFFTSSCKTTQFSLSLNPFKFSPLSAQPSRNQKRGALRFRHPCYSFCLSRSFSIKATMCASPPSIHVKDHIDLTDKEKQIFDRLLEVLRHFNLQTQLRVAGGWVRDKLLGKECYDIDIALNDMLGKEFCDKVNEYLSSTGEVTQGVGVIQSNPDQSKHLETARMRLFDVWIDFVNLRSEDYSENSRIPTMRFGTAKEDAYRRDLTINSLFYNINASSVEDFTQRGIADLKAGKIVTPLPPKQTFLDDPLRVLRAIRFGARFEFVLDEELKIAAADNDVRDALADKISRERIGHEIDLMISGNQPVIAMTYVSELQLFWAVFSLPNAVDPPTPEGCERLCVAYMDTTWRFLQSVGSSSFNDDQRRLGLYAALLLPFRNTVYKDTKGKRIPVVSYIFRSSLKLKSSDADTVISLHIAAQKFLSLIPSLISDDNSQTIEAVKKKLTIDVPVASKLRILTGLLLREIKGFWRGALVLSLLLYPEDIGLSKNLSIEDTKLNEKRELYHRIETAVLEMGLEKVWDLKPLVNGKEIMNILQLKTGGPIVREWQQKLLEWQLAHPSGSAEECVDWMRQTQSKRARTE